MTATTDPLEGVTVKGRVPSLCSGQVFIRSAHSILDKNGNWVHQNLSVPSDAHHSEAAAIAFCLLHRDQPAQAEPAKSEPETVWSAAENEAISILAKELELTRQQVLRQALRLYQLHHERTKAGETCAWSGDSQRAKEFKGAAPPQPASQAGVELPEDCIRGGVVKHYRSAAKQIGSLFAWCVENLPKFPPARGEWLDVVKERLLQSLRVDGGELERLRVDAELDAESLEFFRWQVAQLSQQLDAAVKEVERLKSHLQIAEGQANSWQANAIDLGNEVSGLREQLADEKAKVESLKDEILIGLKEIARLREQVKGSVVRGGPGVVLPEGWFAEGGNSTWWGIVKSDGTTPGCYYGRNYFPLPAQPAETPQPREGNDWLATLKDERAALGDEKTNTRKALTVVLSYLIAREAGCQNT